MHAALRVLAGLAAWQLVATSVAWACSCAPVEAAEVVSDGSTVVVATVEHVGAGVGCSGPARRSVTLDVEEVIAGEGELGRLVVSTAASGAACGAEVAEGERWILVLGGDGRPSIGLCSSWKVLGDDDPWLAELRAAAE